MQCMLVICATLVLFSSWVNPENVSDDFINLINSKQSSWRAGKFSRGSNLTKTLTRSFFPYVVSRRFSIIQEKPCNLYSVIIPESFDARTHWPECADIIGKIRNQGRCESCWAFTATEVMSDRLCIQTKGKIKIQLSPQDLISCCPNCNTGCAGYGVPSKAWHYYMTNGIVSGGDFGSLQGCKPYQESDYFDKEASICTKSCSNPYFNKSYEEDKHFGSDYYVLSKSEECIQAEIMEKGPVQAVMMTYEDFSFYKDGVYVYTMGAKRSAHSVKILGWGVERGLPYWLVANSWGCQWGNLNGFFKIRRGYDECGIAQFVIGGNPKLDNIIQESADNPKPNTTSEKSADNPKLDATSEKSADNPKLDATSEKSADNPKLDATSQDSDDNRNILGTRISVLLVCAVLLLVVLVLGVSQTGRELVIRCFRFKKLQNEPV